MEPRFEDKPAFRVVGRALTVTSPEAATAIPAFWERCLGEHICEALATLHGGQPEAILGLCDDADEATGAWDYLIALETATAAAPDGWVSRNYAARRYAIFAVEGSAPAGIQQTWRYIMEQWLPASGYRYDGGPSFERYGQPGDDPEAIPCEIWLPVRPV